MCFSELISKFSQKPTHQGLKEDLQFSSPEPDFPSTATRFSNTKQYAAQKDTPGPRLVPIHQAVSLFCLDPELCYVLTRGVSTVISLHS